MSTTVITKTCKKCSVIKPVEEFFIRSNKKYDCYCIPCKKILNTEYHKTRYVKSTKPTGINTLTDEQKEKIKEYLTIKIPLTVIAKLINVPYGRLHNWHYAGMLNEF